MPTPTPWLQRRSTWILWLLLLLLGGSLSGLIAITHTTAGVHALARGAHHLLGLNIELTETNGSLARGFFAKHIRLTTDEATIHITDLSLSASRLKFDPKASRWLTIHVPTVHIEEIAWISHPDRDEPKPLQPPTTLSVPIGLDIEQLTLARLRLQSPQSTSGRVIAQDTEASVALAEHIHIRHAASQWAGNRLTLSGRIAGRPPFAIELGGSLVSRLSLPSQDNDPTPDAPIQISWRATDQLTQLNIYAGVAGGPGYRARGTVHAALQPFAPAPLRRLIADLEGIDPAAWWPQAPRAQLQISADLQADATDPDSPLSLNGPLRITNAEPGPINRRALPLESLSATLAINPQALILNKLHAHIAQGSLRGQLRYPLPSAATPAQTPEATLTLDRINLAQLHDGAQPLRISGPLKLQQQPDQTQIQASLQTHSGALSRARLDVQASINSAAVIIHRAQLGLGQGHASVQGQLARSQTMAFELHGKVQALNLGILWRSPAQAAQAPLTDLNGELQAQGSLSPHPQGKATLTVRASRLLGRPLQGQIALALNADEQLTVNAQLRMHNAQLTAQGQLAGRADDLTPSLALSIQAPDLAALGLPLQGALQAQATASGAWRAPAIDIQATASALRMGQQRLQTLSAQASYSGGRDGKLGIQINANDHTHPQGPALSVAQAQLNIDGHLRQMQLNASAQTQNQSAYHLLAAGGLTQHNSKPAWRGSVQQLTASGPLETELTHAADLLISTQHLSIGPARLTVRDTQIDALRITWQRQHHFETSGRFTHWVIASSGIEGEPKLSLNGHWSARATHTLDAHLHIERSQGDLHRPTPTGRVAMGLDTLQLDARVQSNRLQLNAAVQGRHVGSLKAQLQTMLELPESSAPQTWRLAPEQSWSGQLTGQLPALEWINPFLSFNLRDNIRVGGQADIQLKLSGTPRTPQLTGAIQAQALRLAWVEQGLRLDNGTLRATVATGANGHTELILHELSFSGQARVQPQDRRIQSALAAINAQNPAGSLRAQGRVDLRTLEGLVQVQAEYFPLLQRPDRWLIVTGGANYQFSRQRMQLNGAARADAGYIDITQRNAPSLSNDVYIIRSADTEPARPREPRIPLDFTVGIDLGEHFIVRGAGLDTRAVGSLLVKHAGQGLIRATGTIETRDGTYEGYGQKLNIARGRLSFQGPIENPSLDILALRPGLPVDVGVTITRSAANPLVLLYADPPMADFETLSWLVLGRPADETAGDNTALAQAAIGLLGGSGEGLPTQLARRLGIDEFSIRSAQAGSGASLLPRQTVAGSLRSGTQTVGGEIVYIGKRLSDQLTVSYETATTGAGNAVSLSYQLTRRLSLIARAGTESALDLVYSFAFD